MTSDGAMVTVIGGTGEVDVLVTTAGMVALDGYAALGLLSVGVVPEPVATFMGNPGLGRSADRRDER